MKQRMIEKIKLSGLEMSYWGNKLWFALNEIETNIEVDKIEIGESTGRIENGRVLYGDWEGNDWYEDAATYEPSSQDLQQYIYKLLEDVVINLVSIFVKY
jgi:hypothetical protein